jgi:hypothetical protein
MLFEMFLILPRIQRDIVTNVKSLHVKYLLFLTDFNKTLIFLADFGKKLKYQIAIFIKICPVGAELSNADRQTNRHDEASSRFPQFCTQRDNLYMIDFFNIKELWYTTALKSHCESCFSKSDVLKETLRKPYTAFTKSFSKFWRIYSFN